MIKIVATISNFGAAANVGGDVERESVIIEIPTKNIPAKLKKYLEEEDQRKWETLSFSLLDDGT